jgi:hypothetical protein
MKPISVRISVSLALSTLPIFLFCSLALSQTGSDSLRDKIAEQVYRKYVLRDLRTQYDRLDVETSGVTVATRNGTVRIVHVALWKMVRQNVVTIKSGLGAHAIGVNARDSAYLLLGFRRDDKQRLGRAVFGTIRTPEDALEFAEILWAALLNRRYGYVLAVDSTLVHYKQIVKDLRPPQVSRLKEGFKVILSSVLVQDSGSTKISIDTFTIFPNCRSQHRVMVRFIGSTNTR